MAKIDCRAGMGDNDCIYYVAYSLPVRIDTSQYATYLLTD